MSLSCVLWNLNKRELNQILTERWSISTHNSGVENAILTMMELWACDLQHFFRRQADSFENTKKNKDQIPRDQKFKTVVDGRPTPPLMRTLGP